MAKPTMTAIAEHIGKEVSTASREIVRDSVDGRR
jgi:IS30 family transposase